jgi:hypothetical protein
VFAAIQAEQLLNWVNVKSKASQSKDPEIIRLMEQVEESLQDGTALLRFLLGLSFAHGSFFTTFYLFPL